MRPKQSKKKKSFRGMLHGARCRSDLKKSQKEMLYGGGVQGFPKFADNMLRVD